MSELYILVATYVFLGSIALIFRTPKIVVHALMGIAIVSIVILYNNILPVVAYAAAVALVEVLSRPRIREVELPELDESSIRISRVLDVVTPWSPPRRVPPKLKSLIERAVEYSDVYTSEIPEWAYVLLRVDGLNADENAVRVVSSNGTIYNIRLYYSEHDTPRRPAGGGGEATEVFNVVEV